MGPRLPGVAVLCGGAVLAWGLSVSVGVNHLLVAIAIGFVLANIVDISDWFRPGIRTHKLWLATGIVLMGASVTLETILEAGGVVLVVIFAVVGFAIVFVEFLSRVVFGLTDRFGSLLAAGTGICGVSAVVAVAGAIRAREDQIAYAAATVLLFDAITLVVYPIVGDLLGLSDTVFGIWAGLSMFSTGPVVAVGFAHSELAGQWATITKLTRNALIGLVVLVYASYYTQTGAASRSSARMLWEEFPKFVVGFLALVVLASAGVFSPAQQASIENAYNWLFLLAFVGLGTEIRLTDLRDTGLEPALVVLIGFLAVSTLSLALLTVLF